jgi:CBS domain-containing protein
MADKPNKLFENEEQIHSAIRNACSTSFGVLDSNFLCQSLGILPSVKPICVLAADSVESVVNSLKTQRVGCVLVVDQKGKLEGIFSERDYILKVYGSGKNEATEPISTFMTKDPVTVEPTVTMAFALNLMSQGGFRHLPVTDKDLFPVGIISVKNIVDYIVDTFIEDVLNFDLGGLDVELAE